MRACFSAKCQRQINEREFYELTIMSTNCVNLSVIAKWSNYTEPHKNSRNSEYKHSLVRFLINN